MSMSILLPLATLFLPLPLFYLRIEAEDYDTQSNTQTDRAAKAAKCGLYPKRLLSRFQNDFGGGDD